MPKVSIIVPVYNTEKYVEKCLNSIAKQTLQDIEIIIVNDGSTDNSENIIKQWMEKQQTEKIKYFKKQNGGLSDARNFGVEKATGEYISFVDSDDYIDKDLYKNIESHMEKNVDLIKFKMKTFNENGKILEQLDGPVFDICTGEEAFEKLCVQDKFLEPACIYLYRREFFVQNHFKYEIGTYHEDFGLTPYIMIKAKTVVSTKVFGYNYLQRENSITSNNNSEKEAKKAYDVLKHYDNNCEKIEKENVSDKTKMLFKRYYTNSLLLKAEKLERNKTRRILRRNKKEKSI